MGAFLVIFAIIAIPILILAAISDSERSAEIKAHDTTVQQNFIKLNDIKASADFSCTITNGFLENQTRLVVDDVHEVIYVFETGGRTTSMPYSEVNGCEIVVDSQVTGGIKRAVVGRRRRRNRWRNNGKTVYHVL